MDADHNLLGIFLLWILLLTTSAAISNTNKTEGFEEVSRPTLRQSNFFEWLLSIFQIVPSFTTPPPTTVTLAECNTSCTCGTANTVKRIVGGYETQVNQYPWMAMLLFRGHFYCGASLISERYVLSAAHCLKGFPRNFITVRLLAHKIGDRSPEVIQRSADKVVIHTKYSPQDNDNDIGLVRLDKAVEMTEVVRPVCMATIDKTYEGEEAIITGWGVTSEGGQLAQNLMEVKVPILSQMECRQSKYGNDRITDNMLCAGTEKGGLDACQGDSGGPLHVKNADLNTFHLAGVVSWGEGCAREGYPGIYTRVSQYLDWIDENTQDSCKCDIPTKRVDQVEIVIEN